MFAFYNTAILYVPSSCTHGVVQQNLLTGVLCLWVYSCYTLCMRTIILHRGEECLVSDNDFKKLSRYRWYRQTNGYVARYAGRGRGFSPVRMHREILGAKNGDVCDHKNGNRLDNRRSNIRVCSFSENTYNRSPSVRNKSGYVGVHYDKARGKWQARIHIKNKTIILGRFENKEEAVQARKKAEKKYYGYSPRKIR